MTAQCNEAGNPDLATLESVENKGLTLNRESFFFCYRSLREVLREVSNKILFLYQIFTTNVFSVNNWEKFLFVLFQLVCLGLKSNFQNKKSLIAPTTKLHGFGHLNFQARNTYFESIHSGQNIKTLPRVFSPVSSLTIDLVDRKVTSPNCLHL